MHACSEYQCTGMPAGKWRDKPGKTGKLPKLLMDRQPACFSWLTKQGPSSILQLERNQGSGAQQHRRHQHIQPTPQMRRGADVTLEPAVPCYATNAVGSRGAGSRSNARQQEGRQKGRILLHGRQNKERPAHIHKATHKRLPRSEATAAE
jgi:hypothetical protein